MKTGGKERGRRGISTRRGGDEERTSLTVVLVVEDGSWEFKARSGQYGSGEIDRTYVGTPFASRMSLISFSSWFADVPLSSPRMEPTSVECITSSCEN